MPPKSIHDFVDESEIHGLSKVLRGDSRLRRLIWLIAFVFSNGALLAFLINIFGEYTARPITTYRSLTVSDTVPYPTLTICNVAEVDYGKFSFGEFLMHLGEDPDFRDISVVVSICGTPLEASLHQRMLSYPALPQKWRDILTSTACDLLQNMILATEIPESTLGYFYRILKGMDVVLDATVFLPYRIAGGISKVALSPVEDMINRIATVFPGVVPTTHDLRREFGKAVFGVFNLGYDVATKALTLPLETLNGIGGVLGKKRKRRSFMDHIGDLQKLWTKVTLSRGKVSKTVIQNRHSRFPAQSIQKRRRKRSFIGRALDDADSKTRRMNTIIGLIYETISDTFLQLIDKSSFDMHQLISSCIWTDNTGTDVNCIDSFQARKFLGQGTCYSINNVEGQHRLKGDAVKSQLELRLTPLPVTKELFSGAILLPTDLRYKAYLTLPLAALPDNSFSMYPIKEGDTQIFEVDEYKIVTLISSKDSPCRELSDSGKVYIRENCISECWRVLVREALGCWLYDTPRALVDQFEGHFAATDEVLDRNGTDDYCSQSETIEAENSKSNLTLCARKCPLSCRYEQFDINQVISKTRSDAEVLNGSNVIDTTTTVILKQKRATVETLRQVEAYTWYNLLSDLGGSMGLCLGASLLTVFHVLEFMLTKVVSTCYSRFFPKQNQDLVTKPAGEESCPPRTSPPSDQGTPDCTEFGDFDEFFDDVSMRSGMVDWLDKSDDEAH